MYHSDGKEVLISKQIVPCNTSLTQRKFVGREPNNYYLLSIIMCFLNPIMGPVALVFSVMAHRSFKTGDITYTYKWGNYALLTCMLAIIVSMLVGISFGFAMSGIGRAGGYYW